MRSTLVWIALAGFLAACAGQTGPSAVGTGSQPPMWQQWLDQARRDAAAGRATAVEMGPVGIYTFYNNPRPFCYMYIIPGEWVLVRAGAYRSKDGRATAGVSFLLPKDLEGVEGATPVERARNGVTRMLENTLGQPLAGGELTPFESAQSGTWRWKLAPFSQAAKPTALPTIILVDRSPEAVVHITVAGTSDDDGLARRIIESLRTTSDPKCYWPVYEGMVKAMLGGR